MGRVVAVAALLLTTLALAAAPASARVTRWDVHATLSGTYANAVTATPAARCAARYAERVSGLHATFRSLRPIAYDPVAHTLTGALRSTVTGGWSIAGSYVRQVAQPDGTLACATAATPVSCGARVVFEDGHRTSTGGAVRLAVDGTARGAIVSRITAPRLTEQYADAGAPPAGWPGVCTLSPDDEALPATPLFGLSTTGVLDRAVNARLWLPTAKLRARRAFTIHGGATSPTGCPAQGFEPCDEQGSFHLTVRLTPRR